MMALDAILGPIFDSKGSNGYITDPKVRMTDHSRY